MPRSAKALDGRKFRRVSPLSPDYLNVPRLLILHCLTLPLVPASASLSV
jgi:hypothetical protein